MSSAQVAEQIFQSTHMTRVMGFGHRIYIHYWKSMNSLMRAKVASGLRFWSFYENERRRLWIPIPKLHIDHLILVMPKHYMVLSWS